MTEYILEIKLLSPLTSGSGEGRVGLVDRDVAHDHLGLPILPGRRLKGLWREAYNDVVDAWKLCGESLVPVETIFGKTGQIPDSEDICMHISKAELKEANSLRPWLDYLQCPNQTGVQELSAEDVMQYFATVRTQTAIDRQTGSADDNTLRLIRTLRADLVFQAKVHFLNSPDETVINALSRGAAALQYMGTSRTRGLGKVCCRLLGSDMEPIALTGPAQSSQTCTKQTCNPETDNHSSNSDPSSRISSVSSGSEDGISTDFEDDETDLDDSPVSNDRIPTHVLRYRLTLKAPVVIPTGSGDPNTVMTRTDVPGTHLWGVAAWHCLQQFDHTPEDLEFRQAFLDGGLRFLTAYPEADDPPQRLIPIPHSIRELKEDETLVDFVENPPDNDASTKRIERHYARLDTGVLKTRAVKKERNYHHARVANDRRIGRALGTEVTDGGAFFRYEAIQAGQTFQGAVLGTEEYLKKLKHWLKGVDSIRLGRSRSAQYGEAKFEWADPNTEPRELQELTEWNGFVKKHEAIELKPIEHCDSKQCLIITTLSPLLMVNDFGHPDARFPKCELIEILDLDASTIELSWSYTRTEMIGGYQAHLGLPRQQWPAIASGSVFVFNIPYSCNEDDRRLQKECLLKLERNGLGLRKGEGYGRVSVNRQGNIGSGEEILADPATANPGTAPPERVQNVLCSVIRTRYLSEIRQKAMTTADKIARSSVKIPSNSLLGRLRLFLKHDSFVENLDNLRDTAKSKLKEGKINTSDFGLLGLSEEISLLELFKEVWTKKKTWTRQLVTNRVSDFSDVCNKPTLEKMIGTLVDKDSTTMCRIFLDCLLTSLHRE